MTTHKTDLPPRDSGLCYTCNELGHFAKNCPKKNTSTESKGPSIKRNDKQGKTSRQVTSEESNVDHSVSEELLGMLQSDSSDCESGVKRVRVDDHGSHTRCAKVSVQGVPVYGIVDSGADITIIGGSLFKRIATVAKLKKKQLKPPDKQPKTYDGKPFSLDGRINLEVAFNDKVMTTTVYIKLDAKEQLLLSEGVCRQLGVIHYHPDVEVWRGKKSEDKSSPTVPTVKVYLLNPAKLLPNHETTVKVKIDSATTDLKQGPVLFESNVDLERTMGIQCQDALVIPNQDGIAELVVTNTSGFTQTVDPGIELGMAQVTELIEAPSEEDTHYPNASTLRLSSEDVTQRQQTLLNLVDDPTLPAQERQALQDLVPAHHGIFALSDGERGETDLIEVEIDTGDSRPIKQQPRRMPFTVRNEVAKQIQKMQQNGVITPSKSPWSSPVVMVRKKDGSHRFCVDYRKLNSVTKSDQFPLPRIDDMLDQLGKAKCFSTLDLASGYWQIKMHPSCQEKTAFTTPQGLYEFKVMPFGLTNAPAVFQRLMQQVLMGLNPPNGPDFVTVYIDDILVFSKTLKDHMAHLQSVFQRLASVNLKLKPQKCKFFRREVEYLGHIITPQGLKPNCRITEAVQQFPPPNNLKQVRQFLGLSSFYRRYVKNFSQIAQPLHSLTRKDVPFRWTEDCQQAFETLKKKLTEAPVLAYPSFQKPFVVETDASHQGLGAILSQEQEDGSIHPVAYASRALSPQEVRYGITELETLAVVWAMSHYKSYLYGNSVTVFTDHSAIKAILQTPNPTGKHARWWTKVFGSGIAKVNIVHRSGKSNTNADALSRNPPTKTLPLEKERIGEGEVQVAAIGSSYTREQTQEITQMLNQNPTSAAVASTGNDLADLQRKDPSLVLVIDFVEKGTMQILPGR